MSDLAEKDLMSSSLERANFALSSATRLWFLVAVMGQWMFVYYIVAYFGGLTINDGLAGLKNSHLPAGFVDGEPFGNILLGAHLALAAIMTFGGTIQLVPQIRARAINLHRWNGRLFIVTAIIISMAGLYMVWTRGIIGDLFGHVLISVNGVLIIFCAAMAWRYARAKNITIHRRWAILTFVAASGVWLFRVGLMLWVFLTGGAGIDFETFTGPAINALYLFCYVLSLGVVEIYLRAHDNAGVVGRYTMAGSMAILTIFMGIGIFMATMGMWLPRLS